MSFRNSKHSLLRRQNILVLAIITEWFSHKHKSMTESWYLYVNDKYILLYNTVFIESCFSKQKMYNRLLYWEIF
jgi:hypothetical protein